MRDRSPHVASRDRPCAGACVRSQAPPACRSSCRPARRSRRRPGCDGVPERAWPVRAARQRARLRARQPASPPARQPASPPARQPASPPARQPASLRACEPASLRACEPASLRACEPAKHGVPSTVPAPRRPRPGQNGALLISSLRALWKTGTLRSGCTTYRRPVGEIHSRAPPDPEICVTTQSVLSFTRW